MERWWAGYRCGGASLDPAAGATFICSPAENPDRQIPGIRRRRLPASAFLIQGMGTLPNANDAR